jgi:5-methylcytosine-specific restriction endonuclease McrA
MSQYHARMSGRKRQARNQRILAASNVCHICGHPAADAIDHVIALARGGTEDDTNLAPAHHDVPCPTCGKRCNREKADKAWAPIIRRSPSLDRP